MAKKKLLSEAQVRRFMGLAGMPATMVSNVINEMGNYMEKEEDPADDESDMAMDDAEPMDMGGEDAADEPMDAMPEPAPDAGDEDREVSIEEEDIEALEMILAKLKGEEPMDMDDEEEEMEEAMYKRDKDEDEMEEGMYKRDKEEDKMDEELSEVDLQLSEEEIVQEVARRVAKRIIKAKRAKKALDEALGRK